MFYKIFFSSRVYWKNYIYFILRQNPIYVKLLIGKMYEIAVKPRNTKYLEKQKGNGENTFSKIDKASTILQFDSKNNIDKG